jgi:hypothetical protein
MNHRIGRGECGGAGMPCTNPACPYVFVGAGDPGPMPKRSGYQQRYDRSHQIAGKGNPRRRKQSSNHEE